MKARIPILCVLLWFLSGAVVCGQENPWDRALDRYDFFCRQSQELRAKAASGEAVSQQELVSLLSDLAQLRTQLKEAEGSMTPAQRYRFDRIRTSYMGASERRAQLSAIAPGCSWIPRPYPLPIPSGQPVKPSRSVSVVPQETQRHWGAVLLCGLPEVSLGGMLLYRKGLWGAYVKGSSTIGHPSAEGVCYSDGTTPAGYIWTTGRARTSRLGINAGAVCQPFSFLGIYAGVGYGKRNLYWEEASGRWLKVADKEHRGLLADAGVLVPIGRLLLLAGASTIAFRTVSAEVGIGLSF